MPPDAPDMRKGVDPPPCDVIDGCCTQLNSGVFVLSSTTDSVRRCMVPASSDHRCMSSDASFISSSCHGFSSRPCSPRSKFSYCCTLAASPVRPPPHSFCASAASFSRASYASCECLRAIPGQNVAGCSILPR